MDTVLTNEQIESGGVRVVFHFPKTEEEEAGYYGKKYYIIARNVRVLDSD